MKPNQFIVVLGLDDEKRPHAAKFDIVEEQAVRKAANLMGFRTAVAKTSEAKELAIRLTDGRLFSSGRGLVPFVRADLYEKLTKILELEPVASAASITSNDKTKSAGTKPDWAPWDAIKVGTVVIAPEANVLDDGFWPAVVIAISKNGEQLTLRWRDQPKQPQIKINRNAVALLTPTQSK